MQPPQNVLVGAEHVRRYRQTDGVEGHDWLGATVLLLTTTGRRSAQPRTSPLIYREWGDGSHLVVASKGGSEVPPDWLFNLQADPAVRVQIKDVVFRATARVATSAERPAMWIHMVEVFPAYAEFQEKIERTIPVIVLERA